MVARNFNESEMHFLPDPESGGKEAEPTASGVCINNLYGKLSGNKLTKSSKKGIIIKWDIYDIRKSKANGTKTVCLHVPGMGIRINARRFMKCEVKRDGRKRRPKSDDERSDIGRNSFMPLLS